MLYGVTCPKCGLIQLLKPTCKACGSALPAPSEAPPRPFPGAPSRALQKTPLRSPSNTPSEVSKKAPLEMTLDVPLDDSEEVPWGAPSDDRMSRRAKTCSECGMVYFEDELIRFGDALVCGQCKPLFVQKLREGVAVSGEMVYAGF